jgi:hypothetical protein
MKIIQIIPAPTNSYITSKPYEDDNGGYICYYEPCAFLALVEDPEDSERWIVPVTFGDEMHPEIVNNDGTLHPDFNRAKEWGEKRIAWAKTKALEKQSQNPS